MEKRLIQIIGGANVGKTVAIRSFYNELTLTNLGFSVHLPPAVFSRSPDVRRDALEETGEMNFVATTALGNDGSQRIFRPTVKEMVADTGNIAVLASVPEGATPTHKLFNEVNKVRGNQGHVKFYPTRELIPPTVYKDPEGLSNILIRLRYGLLKNLKEFCEFKIYDYPGEEGNNILLTDSVVAAYKNYDLAGIIVIIPIDGNGEEYEGIINRQLRICDNFIANLSEQKAKNSIRVRKYFYKLPLIFLMTRFDSTTLLMPNGNGRSIDDVIKDRAGVMLGILQKGGPDGRYDNINSWLGEKFLVPTAATSRMYITNKESYCNYDAITCGLNNIQALPAGMVNLLPQAYDFRTAAGINGISTYIPEMFANMPLQPWNSAMAWLLILHMSLGDKFLEKVLADYIRERNGYAYRITQ